MLRGLGVLWLLCELLVFRTGYRKKLEKVAEKDPSKAQDLALVEARKTLARVLRVAGTRVTVKGLENIPADTPVLYVGNHRSLFDVIVAYTAAPGRLGFVGKKELEKIGWLAGWMRVLRCVFLDRKNVREGLKTILLCIEYVKNGTSMWIFPEGTRNKGDILKPLPFKEGSLKIAEKAKCPVIPVAMTGTSKILEEHFPFVRAADVTIRFGKPFMISELPEEHRKFPAEYAREIIIGMLREEVGGGAPEEEEEHGISAD